MTTPRPKRRFFRYSLRTLMLVVTVFCVWMGWQVYTDKKQTEAISAFENLGGLTYYDFQVVNERIDPNPESWVPTFLLNLAGHDFFHNVVHLRYEYHGASRRVDPLIADKTLQQLEAFSRIRWLTLYGSQVTDDGMKYVGRLKSLEILELNDASELTDAGTFHLKELRNLRTLHINHLRTVPGYERLKSEITDKSLEYFSNLSQLERLSLQGNRFSDDGLEHIKKLVRLKTLLVGSGDNRITDDGLSHIRSLTTLEVLGLQRTAVTDRGLKTVRNMPKLKLLLLNNTQVTDKGVKKLQRALPNCTISYWIP